MDAKQVIKSAANLSRMVLKSYFSDMEDADLMQRPAEGCNHLAWQLGHLITSECMMLEMLGGTAIELPEGFKEAHDKANADDDNPSHFGSKAEYLELMDQLLAASMAALDAASDTDLDKPSPEHFAQFAPTHGDVYALLATHPMMHAGQFVPVRRKLGKPVLF